MLFQRPNMYSFDVVSTGQAAANVRSTDRAADVLRIVGELTDRHPDCERIIVWFNGTRSFAVDGCGLLIRD